MGCWLHWLGLMIIVVQHLIATGLLVAMPPLPSYYLHIGLVL